MKNNKQYKSYNTYDIYTYFKYDLFDFTLAIIRIFPLSHLYYNKRAYIKIQDYLSQIGGIIRVALNRFPHIIYLISIGRRDEKI